MSRQILTLLLLSTLAGCATTSGTSYYYDGSGDYYHGAGGADVIVDSRYSGFGYGGFGYGGGYGYGYGGLGYGYAYPRYGGLFYPWGFGWSPIWWSPPVHIIERDWREARVQQDRLQRGFLLARPVADAPRSAGYAPHARLAPADAFRGPARMDAGQRRPAATANPRSGRAAAATAKRPLRMATPPPRMSAPAPAPTMRAAPPPARIPSRKQ